ncbi:hypothetical protein LY76DRAFT_246722 [Colletotrichum caudatum]|nr:hypothetical protein LY76DRAFT_246722 [Colletotrichum caudatum]
MRCVRGWRRVANEVGVWSGIWIDCYARYADATTVLYCAVPEAVYPWCGVCRGTSDAPFLQEIPGTLYTVPALITLYHTHCRGFPLGEASADASASHDPTLSTAPCVIDLPSVLGSFTDRGLPKPAQLIRHPCLLCFSVSMPWYLAVLSRQVMYPTAASSRFPERIPYYPRQ